MADSRLRLRKETGKNNVDPRKLRRNITPVHIEAWNMVATPLGAVMGMVVITGFGLFFPIAILPSAIFGFLFLMFIGLRDSIRNPVLPIRLPVVDAGGHIDKNDPKPQHRGFNRARGEWFLGNTWEKQEIWAAFKDAVTHSLVIGGTGAGKTEQLISMEYAGLSCGGGSGYVDPKAGPRLYGQKWTIARFLGRDDDIRVINFALGQEKLGKTPHIRSNTMQPFAFGKGEALKEIPLSLMAGAGGNEGANSIFSSNAKTLISGLMLGLTEIRDKGEIYLSINDIRDYIAPDKYVQLASRNDLSPIATQAMRSFLISMGWKPDVPDKTKWGDFERQYSYAQNYFLGTLSMMSDVYRHIFNVPIGDIHMPDVILQRRIFVTMLPSMEKSTKELSDLGKITLAVIKLAVAVGLGGGEIMGNWKQLVELGPSASRVPFFLFVDEYAAIAIEGFSVVFTQGRSLNVAATVGTQDWDGMQKANKEEAQQIVANTKFKFFMTGDDPNGTKDLIEKLAGEEEEMRAQSFSNSLVNYYDTQTAQAQKVHRIDYQDIKSQVEGEWHLFWKDKIIQGIGFFAGGVPDDMESPLFVHHFLMVERPNYTHLSTRYGELRKILNFWRSVASDSTINMESVKEYPEGYSPLSDIFRAADVVNAGVESEAHSFQSFGRIDSGCAAVYAWINDDPFRFDDFIQARVQQQADVTEDAFVDADLHQPADRMETGSQVIKETSRASIVPSDLDDDDPFSDFEQKADEVIKPSAPVVHAVPAAPAVPTVRKEKEGETDNEVPSVKERRAHDFDKATTAEVDKLVEAARVNPFTAALHSVVGTRESLQNDVREISEKVFQSDNISPRNAEAVAAEVAQKVEELIADPAYPRPPEPPKVTPDTFKKTASEWIDKLKTGGK